MTAGHTPRPSRLLPKPGPPNPLRRSSDSSPARRSSSPPCSAAQAPTRPPRRSASKGRPLGSAAASGCGLCAGGSISRPCRPSNRTGCHSLAMLEMGPKENRVCPLVEGTLDSFGVRKEGIRRKARRWAASPRATSLALHPPLRGEVRVARVMGTTSLGQSTSLVGSKARG